MSGHTIKDLRLATEIGTARLSVFGPGGLNTVVVGLSNGPLASQLSLTREQLEQHRDHCTTVLAHMDDWRDK